MKARTLKKVAALATGAALALSFPVASSASQGGVPNSDKPCPAKDKKKPKKPAPNEKGKKCGFA
jgi:hypothetical protein